MNNRQEWAYNSPYPRSPYHQSSEDSSAVTRATTTIALLVLGYYAFNFFELWPSSLKQRASDTLIDLFPEQFIVHMQSAMMRFGVLNRKTTRFKPEDLISRQAKNDALGGLLGLENNRITTVVRKARTFSGIDNILPPSIDIGPAGLGNWDNSCYQNSVLHGFASLPAFYSFVSKSLDLMRQKGAVEPTHEALVGFLGKLAALDQPKTTLWTPVVLKSMDSWQQQDAQEYFSRVLDVVEKEHVRFYKAYQTIDGLERIPGPDDCNGVRKDLVSMEGREVLPTENAQPQSSPTSNDRSIAGLSKGAAGLPERNPLDGMLAQSLKCRKCGFTEGLSLTQFNCVTVNLGVAGGSCTLERLLDEYTESEDIDGVECTQCTKLANDEVKPLDDTTTLEQEETFSDTEALVIAKKLAASLLNSDELVRQRSIRKKPKTKPKPKPVLSTKSKQLTLGRLPENLVIHLNRSIFDMHGNLRKNSALVAFPLRLCVFSKWCVPLDNVDGETIQAAYALQCVITHAGRHEDGHYIAYAKREKDWYCFNDEVVTKVSEEFVLNRGNAFMLFYQVDNSSTSFGKRAEPTVVIEDICEGASVTPLIEKGKAEAIPNAEQVPGVESEVVHTTTEAEVPAQATCPPVQLPQVRAGATEGMDCEDDTRHSSIATSTASTEEDSPTEIRLENKLPPMRTASESSPMHPRMESSHAAPVF